MARMIKIHNADIAQRQGCKATGLYCYEYKIVCKHTPAMPSCNMFHGIHTGNID